MIPVEYIASGEYAIAIAQQKTMKLLLGSCVGVVIYDREADIGGAIHLLLPEPATPDSTWMPASYATTGLPLFINDLLQAGAKPERLQAVIAGGALFGTISEHDMALNIGGRCIENVHTILKEWQIPIITEESCGFSPSILTLDTAVWQAEITTRFDNKPSKEPAQQPTREEILHSLDAIEPIPQAALKIIHLISEDEHDSTELVATIGSDQVLTGRILRLCNSALVAPRHPIDSLDKAVLILGQEHLLQMVAVAAVSSLLAEHQGGYALLKGGLYKHAVGTACASKILAQETRLVSPGTAYTAGLLHDIGKVVLDRYFASFQPLFYQHNNSEEVFLTSLETQFLGIDHQEAGKLLADTWALPQSITQVIACHHSPAHATSHQDLVNLVSLADLLTSCYLAGHEFKLVNGDSLKSSLHHLGLTAEKLPALIDKIPWAAFMYL